MHKRTREEGGKKIEEGRGSNEAIERDNATGHEEEGDKERKSEILTDSC